MDPREMDGVTNTAVLETADEISQFVHYAQWMEHNIPDFPARFQQLRDILELSYDRRGRHTSKAISKVRLQDIAWSSVHMGAMRSIQESLENTVSLAHFDPKKASVSTLMHPTTGKLS